MDAISIEELEAQRATLLRQLRRSGPVVEGSLATVPRTCGNPNCRCMREGPKHEAVILCKKVQGRSVALHVPKALREQVGEWNREHKRVKRVLKQISQINEQIIRQYVGQQRAARRAARSLKVLQGGKD